MSRRRRNNRSSNAGHGNHRRDDARRDARPAGDASSSAPRRGRERDRDRPLVDHSARYGVQGAGHPAADAPFVERMAPYAASVDSVIRSSAAKLHGNVDVSFMQADFARFVDERMLVVAMSSLLARNGKGKGAAALQLLVGMVESHQDRQDRRNGHANGNGHHRPVSGIALDAAQG